MAADFLIGHTGLENLDLSRNDFSSMPVDMEHLKKLEELNIDGNSFKVVTLKVKDHVVLTISPFAQKFDEKTFDGLTSLTTLRAGHMWTLESVEEMTFGKTPSLKILSLKYVEC